MFDWDLGSKTTADLSVNSAQVSLVTVPGFDGVWCQHLFDDVDGLVLWC